MTAPPDPPGAGETPPVPGGAATPAAPLPPEAAPPSFEGRVLDDPIVRADAAGTAVFTVAATAAAAFPDPLAVAVAVLDCVLFALGVVAFLWAFSIGVGRSRTEAVAVGALYFLAGSTAPARIRRAFGWLLAVQCVVAVATASARVYTAVAFGVLVPMLGLGLMGVWGARHGRFPARDRRS